MARNPRKSKHIHAPGHQRQRRSPGIAELQILDQQVTQQIAKQH